MSKQSKKKKANRRGSRGGYHPLPQRFKVALMSTYRWNTTVSAGSATHAYVDVSDANSFAPYYYDQLMTIYKNFVVDSVDIEYRVVNRSLSSEAEIFLFDINRKAYDAGITTVIAESLPGATRHILTSTGNSKTVTVKRKVPLAQFYKKGFSSDSDFWGDLYTAPPICSETTRKANIYNVIFYTAANGSDTITYTTDRRITYHMTFFNFWTSNISLASELPSKLDPDSLPDKDAKRSISKSREQCQPEMIPARPTYRRG